MEDHQDHDTQEGEELLKMLGVEGEKEEGEGETSEVVKDDGEVIPPVSPLLSLTEISRQTGIMYVTLKRYAVLHDATDLAGLWEGEGRNKKYRPEAVGVFLRLKAESKKGRPRGQKPEIAPLPTSGRRGWADAIDPLPPSIPAKKGKKRAKKGAGKRPGKPTRTHTESAPLPASSPSLSTQEADRAMAAIERVQLMARYEAVKEMVAPWIREMQRLEQMLGLGEAER